ncbi:MAG: inorganic diphosphatase [Patescibacteria group bacterium]
MDIAKISAGKNFPKEVNVVIEIPQGSSVKYELDKTSGALMVDRFLYTATVFPFNYGFIPQTHAKDGDPEDVLVISSFPVNSGSIIAARPVGMLEMEDEAGQDSKIIAVPTEKIDPCFAKVQDIGDLDDPTKNKIKHFFETYKQLEPGKWVKVKEFLNKEKALQEISKSQS